MSTPRRYRFDNPLQNTGEDVQAPVYRPVPVPEQQSVPQVVHIHQASPDRMLQRLALGAGMGAGVVAAGGYFLPLLVAALQSLVMGLISLAFALAVVAWAVRVIVNAVDGKDARRAAQSVARTRRSRLRRR